jgi:hypothetical protein
MDSRQTDTLQDLPHHSTMLAGLERRSAHQKPASFPKVSKQLSIES